MPELHIKAFRAQVRVLEDDAPLGSFEARFAKLDVMDHTGSVIPSGAIGEQEVAIAAWGHNHGVPPVGMGRTYEEDGFGVVKGRFFLGTAAGMEHYTVVKARGGTQEWSFGFFINAIEWKDFDGKPDVPHLTEMDIFETSPVYRGAGIDTQTVEIKELNRKGTLFTPDGVYNVDKDGRVTPASWPPVDGKEQTPAPAAAAPEPEPEPDLTNARRRHMLALLHHPVER